jgi:hypothetical protein
MRGIDPEVRGFLFFIFGVLVLSMGFAACVKNADVATYTADGLACVDKAATRTEADACRCDVEKRYNRPLKHCALTGPKDAGAE